MSLLCEFESSVESAWVRHECKYDTLCDFLPVHCSMLKPLRHETHHQYAMQYVSDRRAFRKDLISMQLNMQCNADLTSIEQLDSRKRKRASTETDDEYSCVYSAAQLAANLTAFASLEIHQKKLSKFAHVYSCLFDSLEVYKGRLLNSNIGLAAAAEGSFLLPLTVDVADLVELQLVNKLQLNAQVSVDMIKILGEEQLPPIIE
jgi:hypothetical protein